MDWLLHWSAQCTVYSTAVFSKVIFQCCGVMECLEPGTGAGGVTTLQTSTRHQTADTVYSTGVVVSHCWELGTGDRGITTLETSSRHSTTYTVNTATLICKNLFETLRLSGMFTSNRKSKEGY